MFLEAVYLVIKSSGLFRVQAYNTSYALLKAIGIDKSCRTSKAIDAVNFPAVKAVEVSA
jgi:hypothetical protein